MVITVTSFFGVNQTAYSQYPCDRFTAPCSQSAWNMGNKYVVIGSCSVDVHYRFKKCDANPTINLEITGINFSPTSGCSVISSQIQSGAMKLAQLMDIITEKLLSNASLVQQFNLPWSPYVPCFWSMEVYKSDCWSFKTSFEFPYYPIITACDIDACCMKHVVICKDNQGKFTATIQGVGTLPFESIYKCSETVLPPYGQEGECMGACEEWRLLPSKDKKEEQKTISQVINDSVAVVANSPNKVVVSNNKPQESLNNANSDEIKTALKATSTINATINTSTINASATTKSSEKVNQNKTNQDKTNQNKINLDKIKSPAKKTDKINR